MRLAAIFKSSGSGEAIFPDGLTLYTAPNDLFIAFEQALRVLSWQELPEDECPKSWMWHLDWEIEDWFIKVKNDRKRKYGTSGDSDYLDPDADDYQENVLFEEMKRGGPLFDD